MYLIAAKIDDTQFIAEVSWKQVPDIVSQAGNDRLRDFRSRLVGRKGDGHISGHGRRIVVKLEGGDRITDRHRKRLAIGQWTAASGLVESDRATLANGRDLREGSIQLVQGRAAQMNVALAQPSR